HRYLHSFPTRRSSDLRIFETVLYAEDLAAAERFYHEALGLEVIECGNLAAVFRCDGGVLLIFDPRKSAAPGRDVPAHGTSGAGRSEEHTSELQSRGHL